MQKFSSLLRASEMVRAVVSYLLAVTGLVVAILIIALW
jgi:hypothetical protein